MLMLRILLLALTVLLFERIGLAAEGVQRAVLIGVRDLDQPQFNTIQFAGQDVTRVRGTLIERAGARPADLLELTSDADPHRQPTRKNVIGGLKSVLAACGPRDRVLIYFTGHGELINGVTYLVTRDYDRKNPAATGVSVRELREALEACPAAVKLIVLDCCHAGGAKGESLGGVSGEALAKAIVPASRTSRGCVVLASCRDREQSYEWPARQQSIFTFWFCQGLEGSADKDGDAIVTAEELYEYLHARVPATARVVAFRPQTPVREFGLAIEGVTPVLRLRPNSPESACRRLADMLNVEIRRRKLPRIGVLEFLRPLGNADGLAAESLPAYCADQVRERLQELAPPSYEVIDAQTIRTAARGLSAQALGDPDQMKPLAAPGVAVSAVVAGSIRRRGRNLHVQCDLIDVTEGERLGQATAVIPLNEDRLGDLGHSFDNRDRKPEVQSAVAAVQRAEELARQPHPALDPNFPFPIEVWSVRPGPNEPKITDTTPRVRKPFQVDRIDGRDQLLIGAREEELFELRVRNRSGRRVGLTLLLDGLNSLGQRRERLGAARSWLLEPGDREYRFDGWTFLKEQGTTPNVDARLRHFKFTDVSKSVAGRKRFGESVGLITLAFYGEADGRSLAIGEGPEDQRRLQLKDFRPGELLAVIQIRYVDERDLNK